MAFSIEEDQLLHKAMDAFINKNRPKPEIRDQLDIAYKIYDQSIEIFEIRKNMDNKIINCSIAKTTFNRSTNKWKIYWQRSDLKWHGYQPNLEVTSINKFIKIVEEDKLCCFWG